MTLLNIGLRRYTLPPTQGWRQGGPSRTVSGAGPSKTGEGQMRFGAIDSHPPSSPTMSTSSSLKLTHQSACLPRCCRPFNTTPPRVDSRRRIPPLLPPYALQLPLPHRDAIFEHPSGLARHSPWHCLFALEPRIDARPQDVPNLIYEPRSAMLDAWMGVAGSPCDRNVLTTPTAASQTRDAGGNQAIMNRPPLRMARLERDMARIGNRHAQSSACSDPSCPRSPGPSPPAEPAQRASEVSVRRTDVNASKRRLAPEHRPTALPLCAPRMNH